MATFSQKRPRIGSVGPIQWIMVGIILLALGGGGYALQGGALVAYASIPEAKAYSRSVQVLGYLYSRGAYAADGSWQFDIQGPQGDILTVAYPYTKPSNFEQATSVVAIGKYDRRSQKFLAERLLVKCPSKYQEAIGTKLQDRGE